MFSEIGLTPKKLSSRPDPHPWGPELDLPIYILSCKQWQHSQIPVASVPNTTLSAEIQYTHNEKKGHQKTTISQHCPFKINIVIYCSSLRLCHEIAYNFFPFQLNDNKLFWHQGIIGNIWTIYFSRILKSKKKKMWAAIRRGQDDPVKLVSSDIISGFFYFSIYSYVL